MPFAPLGRRHGLSLEASRLLEFVPVTNGYFRLSVVSFLDGLYSRNLDFSMLLAGPTLLEIGGKCALSILFITSAHWAPASETRIFILARELSVRRWLIALCTCRNSVLHFSWRKQTEEELMLLLPSMEANE